MPIATATTACTCTLAHYTITGIPVIAALDNACPAHGCPEPAPAPAAEFTHHGFTATPSNAKEGAWVLSGDLQANRIYKRVTGIVSDGVCVAGDADAVRQLLDHIIAEDPANESWRRNRITDCKGWVWSEAKQRKVKCTATMLYATSHYCPRCRDA